MMAGTADGQWGLGQLRPSPSLWAAGPGETHLGAGIEVASGC